MRFEDLSPADQKLLNTDLGEFEKEAAARLSMCDEMYAVGFSKLAMETADNLDAYYEKVASAEESDDSIQLDGESEKVANELASFIEKGYFDGLRKLGAERYDDELAYILPFLEEKIAAKGAREFLGRMGGKLKAFGAAAKEKGKKGLEAAKTYHAGGKGALGKAEKSKALKDKVHSAGAKVKGAVEGAKERVRGAGGKVKAYHTGAFAQAKGGGKETAKGVGKLVGPYAALAGLGGAGAYAAKKKKD